MVDPAGEARRAWLSEARKRTVRLAKRRDRKAFDAYVQRAEEQRPVTR
jgi:hypothetical protein